MTEPAKRGRGRPRGTGTPIYLKSRGIRFTEAQAAAITGLARRWQTTEAEAVRRAVLETARREKVP